MVVVKLSYKVEGYVENIDATLWRGLYKEEDNSFVDFPVTDPYAKMNCFTWSKGDNYWIVPGYYYNEEFKNWQGPIHNGQLLLHTFKKKINTKDIWSKYEGYENFNGIPREGNPSIPINSYKYQCRDHMISNGMWGVFSLPDPHNKYNNWYILLHQYIFPLEYIKRHVQILQKLSEADQYVVQNLIW